MELELTFNGTPAQFAVMAQEYGNRLWPQICIFEGGLARLDPSTNPTEVIFHQKTPQSKGRGLITAHTLPEGKSLLRVTAKDDAWPQLAAVWAALVGEMQRQGWVADDPSVWSWLGDDKDAEIVWLRWRNSEYSEIAEKVWLAEGTVRNRCAALKKRYGKWVLPAKS